MKDNQYNCRYTAQPVKDFVTWLRLQIDSGFVHLSTGVLLKEG